MDFLNYNFVETLPGYKARAAFTVNSASVFKEDVDIVPTIVDITDRRKQQERIVREKQQILDFLTGAENRGKAWFSTFYVTPDGKEQHDVVINKIDDSKKGSDWETDIQEAINMICFTMRVHSNLVGSVPGKAQSNNSGSDKRELYTIAQALQSLITTFFSPSTASLSASTAGKALNPSCRSYNSLLLTKTAMLIWSKLMTVKGYKVMLCRRNFFGKPS